MTLSRREALASASESSTECSFWAATPRVRGLVIAATALDSPRAWEDNSYRLLTKFRGLANDRFAPNAVIRRTSVLTQSAPRYAAAQRPAKVSISSAFAAL
jgi:hypothetical protein